MAGNAKNGCCQLATNIDLNQSCRGREPKRTRAVHENASKLFRCQVPAAAGVPVLARRTAMRKQSSKIIQRLQRSSQPLTAASTPDHGTWTCSPGAPRLPRRPAGHTKNDMGQEWTNSAGLPKQVADEQAAYGVLLVCPEEKKLREAPRSSPRRLGGLFARGPCWSRLWASCW